ncbi:MAG: DUF4911 domain-containing protein, partial [Candidatus Binatia bacterium]
IRLRPEDISYVKFIFESYETVGFLRTIDPQAAVLVVLVVPDFAEVGEAILESIAEEIAIERVPGPSHLGDDWLVATIYGDDEAASGEGGALPKA